MLKRLLALCALFLAASPAAAWWEYGHQTVGRIGYMEARPATQAAIRRLLAQSKLLDTPTCPAATVEDASYWPDCIKGLGERFSYSTPWHYQNVDICKPFDLKAACRDGNCVSAQVERNLKLLADKTLPARERVMALAFLIHFVGDLHMPLHAGDKGDLGGNRFSVTYGVIAGRTNLHGTWDGWIAERGISNPPGGPGGVLGDFSAEERAGMQTGTVEEWSREGWDVAREFAYGTVMADPCGPVPAERPVIEEATTRKLVPIARRQIARGGLRLARLLDEALS
ncbi:MAG TPA: S1/P1 nuclease [Allosphingosinicella sp.]